MIVGLSMAEQPDLPAGITRELRPVSDRLDVHYRHAHHRRGPALSVVVTAAHQGLCRFTCHKDGVLCGERLCDRAAKMPQALQEHLLCQPGWAHLQRKDPETPNDHVQRLKATFSYKKTEADRDASAKLKAGSNRTTSSGPAPHRQAAKPESGSASVSIPAAQQHMADPKARSPPKPAASPARAPTKAKTAAPARAAASNPVPEPSKPKQPLQPRNSNSAGSPIRRYFKVVQPGTQPQKAGAGPISAPAKLAAAPKHDATPRAQPTKANTLPLSPRQARLAAEQEAGVPVHVAGFWQRVAEGFWGLQCSAGLDGGQGVHFGRCAPYWSVWCDDLLRSQCAPSRACLCRLGSGTSVYDGDGLLFFVACASLEA